MLLFGFPTQKPPSACIARSVNSQSWIEGWDNYINYGCNVLVYLDLTCCIVINIPSPPFFSIIVGSVVLLSAVHARINATSCPISLPSHCACALLAMTVWHEPKFSAQTVGKIHSAKVSQWDYIMHSSPFSLSTIITIMFIVWLFRFFWWRWLWWWWGYKSLSTRNSRWGKRNYLFWICFYLFPYSTHCWLCITCWTLSTSVGDPFF